MLRRVGQHAAKLLVQSQATAGAPLLTAAHDVHLLRCCPQAAVMCQATLATAVDAKATLFNASPRSLACERGSERPKPGVEESPFMHTVLRIAGYYSNESKLMRGSKSLYDAVVEQSTNKKLYDELGLPMKFATVYSMLCIHIWLLLVRLRAEGKDGKELAQNLYENFTDDVELRVRAEGVKVRISKWLNELEKMFYGSSTAYDKSLKGEEDLPAALLRNVFGNEASKQKEADRLARYIKRELACLSMTETDDVLTGTIKFSSDWL